MELGNRARKNVLLKFSGEVLSHPLSILFYIYIARKLGTENFGLYSFAFSFCGLFLIFSDLGLGTLMVRDVSREKENLNKYFGNILSLKILFSVLILILVNITIRILHYPSNTVRIVQLMTFFTITIIFLDYLGIIFTSIEKIGYESLLKTLNKGLLFGIAFFVLLRGYGLEHLILFMSIGSSVVIILGFLIYRAKVSNFSLFFDFKTWQQLLAAAVPLALGLVFVTIYQKIDVILLSFFNKSNAEIGWYSAGKIVDTLNAIPALIMGGMLPIFSDVYKNERSIFTGAIEKTYKFLILIALPLAFGAFIFSKEIVHFLYGKEFVQTGQVLRIFAWGIYFIFVNVFFSSVLIASEKQKFIAIGTGLSALINILLNIIFIPKYGFLGAGISYVAGQCVLFVLFLRFSEISKMSLWKTSFKPLLASFLVALIVIVLKNYNLFISIFCCAFFYSLLVYFLMDRKISWKRIQ